MKGVPRRKFTIRELWRKHREKRTAKKELRKENSEEKTAKKETWRENLEERSVNRELWKSNYKERREDSEEKTGYEERSAKKEPWREPWRKNRKFRTVEQNHEAIANTNRKDITKKISEEIKKDGNTRRWKM